MDLRGASLRMTPFGGDLKYLVGCKKREKIEKVTGSRDDKGKGNASMESRWWAQGVFHHLGGSQAYVYSG